MDDFDGPFNGVTPNSVLGWAGLVTGGGTINSLTAPPLNAVGVYSLSSSIFLGSASLELTRFTGFNLSTAHSMVWRNRIVVGSTLNTECKFGFRQGLPANGEAVFLANASSGFWQCVSRDVMGTPQTTITTQPLDNLYHLFQINYIPDLMPRVEYLIDSVPVAAHTLIPLNASLTPGARVSTTGGNSVTLEMDYFGWSRTGGR